MRLTLWQCTKGHNPAKGRSSLRSCSDAQQGFLRTTSCIATSRECNIEYCLTCKVPLKRKKMQETFVKFFNCPDQIKLEIYLQSSSRLEIKFMKGSCISLNQSQQQSLCCQGSATDLKQKATCTLSEHYVQQTRETQRLF